METAGPVLKNLGVDLDRVPVVTRDQVRYAKPDPDLFVAAAERLGVAIETTVVVGDAIWDMLAARRARALGIGLLSGGSTARPSWRAAAPTACSRTRPTCCATSTRSAAAAEAAASQVGLLDLKLSGC